jgi:hypothetical protein
MKNLDQEIGILVCSCDEYADVWDPFFYLFKSKWDDCPYPLFLSSVTKKYSNPAVHQILVGSRVGWGDGVLKALKLVLKTSSLKYIILMLDDYLLDKKVDTLSVSTCVKALDDLNGHYLRLIPKPPPDRPVAQYDFIGEILKNSPYRTSLQVSIWRVGALMDLIQPNDTPWDMELFGSQRSNQYNGFYSSYKPIISYLNGIERGLWVPESVQFLKNKGIFFDTSSRPVSNNIPIKANSFENIFNLLKRKMPLKHRMFLRTLYAKLTNKHIQ